MMGHWAQMQIKINIHDNILVMQHFRVVYHGISHLSLEFSLYTHEPHYFIPCHRNYSGQHNQWCMMGRLGVIPLSIQWLSCILIGCMFYGMVLKSVRTHQVCDHCFSVFPWAVPQTEHTSDTLRAEDGGYFNFSACYPGISV